MKPFLPIAAAVLLCSSCMPVPFDLALSQGAAATSRMTRVNTSLITVKTGFDPSTRDFAFYPQILASGPDCSNGFVVSARDLSPQVTAVKEASPGTLNSYSGQSFFIANPDPYAPPYAAWPVQVGTSYFLGITFDALDPFNLSSYILLQGDPVAGTMTTVGGFSGPMASRILSDLGVGNAGVIGASVSAGDTAGTFKRVHWLGANTGVPGQYLEIAGQVSAAALVMSATPRGLFWADLSAFIPNGLTRCMYFYDEDPARLPNRSFASWWDTGKGGWVSYAWWEEPTTGSGVYFHKQLPIDHRLDALLSTGQLLSTEGSMARLYDRDGNLQASFPLGNLVYIGEEYVGGAARCYFSQCLIYDHTLHFNVYWIATDQLTTLVD